MMCKKTPKTNEFLDRWTMVAFGLPFRLFLSICAKSNLTIYQADVKAAFLQAPLKEEIYMRAPPGFRGDDGGDNVIWKL